MSSGSFKNVIINCSFINHIFNIYICKKSIKQQKKPLQSSFEDH